MPLNPVTTATIFGISTVSGENIPASIDAAGAVVVTTATTSQSLLSTDNSTADPLGISATYTGTWEQIDAYSTASASITGTSTEGGTLYFEIRHADAGGADASIPRVIGDPSFDVPHMFLVAEKWFRIRYVNGAVAHAGTFSIQTIYNNGRPMGVSAIPGDVVGLATQSDFVRVVGEPLLDINRGAVAFYETKSAGGINDAVTNASLQVLRSTGGLYVPSTKSETIRIKGSGNLNDASGGTGAWFVSVTFLDDDWLEVTESLIALGATQSLATTSLCRRIISAKVLVVGTLGGFNIGNIVFENTTTAEVLGTIDAGRGKMTQAVCTIPAGQTGYITDIEVSVGQSDSADVRLIVLESVDVAGPPYSAGHEEWSVSDFKGATNFELKSYIAIPEKSDVYMDAQRITGSGSARVHARFEMTLVANTL